MGIHGNPWESMGIHGDPTILNIFPETPGGNYPQDFSRAPVRACFVELGHVKKCSGVASRCPAHSRHRGARRSLRRARICERCVFASGNPLLLMSRKSEKTWESMEIHGNPWESMGIQQSSTYLDRKSTRLNSSTSLSRMPSSA